MFNTGHGIAPWAHCFKPSRYNNASFYIPENRLKFPTTKGFRTKNSMKLVYQYMAIFFNFENCDRNSRLVVDEMTMVNSGLKGLKNVPSSCQYFENFLIFSTLGGQLSHRQLSHLYSTLILTMQLERILNYEVIF